MKAVRIFLFLICFSTILMAQIQTIAVLDLEAKGIGQVEASLMTDRIRSELVNVSKYVVVDRSNLDEVFKEQRFQLSGFTSEQYAIEVGKILGVQNMLAGSIGKIGDSYTIHLQILNVELSAITQSTSYDYAGDLEYFLQEGLRNALNRLLEIEQIPEIISTIGRGILEIRVMPAEAIIKIDGLEYELSNSEQVELLKGKHSLEIKLPYYHSYSEDIIIQENQTLPLTVELVKGEKELIELQRRNRLWSLGSGSSIAATILSAILAQSMYNKYQEAESVADADFYKSNTETLDIITIGLTGISLSSSVYTYLSLNKEKRLKQELSLEE